VDKERLSDNFSYVVGAEKRLRDLITGAEVMPLLDGAVKAGALSAAITDSEGVVLSLSGAPGGKGRSETAPVSLEGEVVGRILLTAGAGEDASYLNGILCVLSAAVNRIIYANLKRVLTTEAHTTVVSQSYEELLETNKKLGISEGKYRELAATLEKKVEERTRELKRAHESMFRKEKMASIGQLAAGLAHEINNPIGYVSSNIQTLRKYVSRLGTMLVFYRAAVEGPVVGEDVRQEARQRWNELKLDVISADMDDLIQQCIDGAERVKKIVSDMQSFAHVEDGEETRVDINREIDRTLNLVTHEIAGGTEIIREYHPLPGYICNPALLCQVFLNIILNALQSGSEKPRIFLGTRYENNVISVRIADNGTGIPENILDRIFDPFFTTKEVGKGTGMGLSVAYEIVTAYGGAIEVESGPGEGTSFVLRLPVRGMTDV
jgi:two-component system, NtrC family, sensor kinase